MRRRDVMKTALGAAALAVEPGRALAGAEGATWAPPPKGGVRMIENRFVPMADGGRLAVQLWLPEGAETRPAPVVLEYIPYRKRDRYRAYGQYWGNTLAARGIGYARLETRGSGDSTGVLADEYLPSEQRDAVAAIAWLADQPWCNGAVGMRGVSWGGFSTLQAAALAPPALKAIMPMCASDRRYTDDAHYVGGAFALTGLKWATSMKVVMAQPPDPLISGEAWRSLWRERLDATPAIAARWLSHQTEDAYWRQGSVAFDYDAIRCPVYVVGGLVDSYGNEIPRLLAHLKVPRKGLYGPWRHGYPSPASPGPGLDWAWEETRWWREHLMGEPTGIMADPMLRVFMPDATAAQVAPGPIPGRWAAEASWPSPQVAPRSFHPAAGILGAAPTPGASGEVSSGRLVGLAKLEWVPFAPTELPREQSADDAASLTFDTPALTEALEILGAPVLHTRVTCDQPVAQLAARLTVVEPDGRSWLVAYGVLNLTHRGGHTAPEALTPGTPYAIDLPLHFTAHRFAAGTRIRLALSAGLWPLVWPAPRVARLTLDLAATRLDLPVRTPPAQEAPMPISLAPAPPEEPGAWPEVTVTRQGGAVRVEETWPLSASTVAEIDETVSGSGPNLVLTQTEGDPLSGVWTAEQTARYARQGWDVALSARVSLRATAESFILEERTEARLNGEPVADVKHTTTIPRVLA